MSWEIASVVAIGIIVFTFAFLAVNSKKHGPMQYLFLFMSLFSMLVCLNTSMLILDNASEVTISDSVNGLYFGVMFAIILCLAYFILTFIFDKLRLLGQKNDTGQY